MLTARGKSEPDRGRIQMDNMDKCAIFGEMMSTAKGRKKIVKAMFDPIHKCKDPEQRDRMLADLCRAMDRTMVNLVVGFQVFSTCDAGEKPNLSKMSA